MLDILAVILLLTMPVCGEPDENSMFLILGTQRGVLTQEFRVFLASLRSTGCQARVVIFSGEPPGDGLIGVAKTFRAELIEYDHGELASKVFSPPVAPHNAPSHLIISEQPDSAS